MQKWLQWRDTGLLTLYVGDTGVTGQSGTAIERNEEGQGMAGTGEHLCQPTFYHNLTQGLRNEW